jgi:ABC-2 type transport system ATP-binding protein/ribosome-dependent ATPase
VSGGNDPDDRPLVEARRVTRRFGAFTAVDDVSLELRRGEVVGLLGANGAGKTTVIRILLGLLAPTRGSAAMFGQAPTRNGRRRIGYVPQGLGLYDDMTVAENVEFTARAFGVPVDDVVLPSELDAVRHRLVGDIGLGRQRQLAFATALGHRPDLLVLDEPTSGVDPLARARLWDRIGEAAEGGAGVLVTTHYMQEAEQCDRLVMMASGTVVARGSADDIVSSMTAVEVTSEDWAEAFLVLSGAEAAVTLAGQRIRVSGVSVGEVESMLVRAGLRASVAEVAATLDEAMVRLDGG